MPYHGGVSPCLIGIAGPSGAGKSELARRLAERLHAPVLSLDSYYRDLSHLEFSQRAHYNFDQPEALEEALLAQHVRMLVAGLPVEKPVYDFTLHVRAPHRETIAPADFVIVEGLFALYWDSVRRWLKLKIFVEAPDHVCLERRLERDVRERGRTPESVRQQYESLVRPMAQRYVLPTRCWADLIISGTDPLPHSVAKVLAWLAKSHAYRPAPERG